MATTTSYGTGTALQFTDATQRQVLELGEKIHYYNPEVTPIFTIFGMNKSVTPVPIFEWMEDEYMIRRSVKKGLVTATAGEIAVTADIGDTTTGGINGHNSIINFDKQSDMELFEVGGLYSVATSGDATHATAVTHVIAVAIGSGVNSSTTTGRMVQFIGCHVKSGDASQYQIEQCADNTDLFGVHADEIITLTHVGTAGAYTDGGTLEPENYGGRGLWQAETLFVDDDEYALHGPSGMYSEGAAIGTETRKQVRRLKNCTQIFREPYTITNTAKASQHYGGSELSRLQGRKLAQIKTDIEYAMLTNGAISLDSSVENPTRTFQGIGVGNNLGSIQTNNGNNNTNLQVTEGTETVAQFNNLCAYIFDDMVSGTMKKTVFCSNRWLVEMARITDLAQANYTVGSAVTGGIRTRSWLGPVGELEFVQHPLLSGGLSAYAVAIDRSNFNVRPLNSRDMQLGVDVVKDGRDGQTDEWLMEVGIEMRNEQTHAIMKLV